MVNAARSAGTPACSITAITREPFVCMRKRVQMLSIGCYDAFVGFSDGSEGGITTPSLGVNTEIESLAILVSSLVVFRSEDRFRIGAGNFAHRNPAEAANQRADQE